jgi:two-component sensor histidine kinase
VTLALALHELAVNAVKFGSLSRGGQVTFGCRVVRSADRIALDWAEHGGPVVTPPARRGFGARILEQALPHELQGRVTLDYRPAGLTCFVEGRLSMIEV